jgi:hypothetical protein
LVTPEAPIAWRGLSFDNADAAHSLVELAQKALGEGNDSTQAIATMEQLFTADLRGAFTASFGN